MMRLLHLLVSALLAIATFLPATAAKVRGTRLRNRQRQSHTHDVVHPLRRLDDEDNSTFVDIQEILDESLPSTNNKLRAALDDPLKLNLTQAVPVGCKTLALHIAFRELKGLSSIEVESLEAEEGTETAIPRFCDQTNWGAGVDQTIVFNNYLVVVQPKARLVGRCNGQYWDTPISVGISSSGVYYEATANMKGLTGPTANVISESATLGTLRVNTPNTEVVVSLIPQKLSKYTDTITSQIEGAFYKTMAQDVEPIVRANLERYIPSPGVGIVATAVNAARDIASNVADTFLDQVESFLNGWDGWGADSGSNDKDGSGDSDDDDRNDDYYDDFWYDD